MKEKTIDFSKLKRALEILNEQLLLMDSPPVNLVVCGGSALIATGLVSRTTQDIDVLATVTDAGLTDPEPFPDVLLKAAQRTGRLLNLPDDWLNCGPADLFRMGLPEGFAGRLIKYPVGDALCIYFAARLDQIYFKLYASVDRGGYHINDLQKLAPSVDELTDAAKWCMTQDVSEGFRFLLVDMLEKLGWNDVARRI